MAERFRSAAAHHSGRTGLHKPPDRPQTRQFQLWRPALPSLSPCLPSPVFPERLVDPSKIGFPTKRGKKHTRARATEATLASTESCVAQVQRSLSVALHFVGELGPSLGQIEECRAQVRCGAQRRCLGLSGERARFFDALFKRQCQEFISKLIMHIAPGRPFAATRSAGTVIAMPLGSVSIDAPTTWTGMLAKRGRRVMTVLRIFVAPLGLNG